MYKLSNIPTDTNKYDFGKPIKGDGFYSMYVTTKDNEDNITNLFFQSPKMTVQSDFEVISEDESEINVDEEEREYKGRVAEYADLSCDNEEYINAINTLDESFMQAIKTNAEEWFPGKGIDETFLEVGQAKNLRKSNTVKFKITRDTEGFNDKKESIDLRSIKTSQKVRAMIELVGLWFTSNRWGVMWKLAQIKTCEKTKNISRGYLFPDDEEVDTNNNILTPPPGV
tara:strand:- start:223 stop:903 length:681 start_codon:yes stop_codon:yes gene_type:complete